MGQAKQKAEAALFICALLVLVAAAAVYLRSHKPPPEAKAKVLKPKVQPEEATAKAGPQLHLGRPLKASKRDPFGSPIAGQPASSPAGVPVANSRGGRVPTPPGSGSAPVPPPPLEFTLTGIIAGEAPAAVIRQKDKSYTVGVGDPVDDYSVLSIGEDRVVLAKGRERIVLKLGRQ